MKILAYLSLIVLLQACSTIPLKDVKPSIWKIECIHKQDNLTENSFHTYLSYAARNSKRCEIATHDLININEAFELSFVFSTDYIEKKGGQWHSLFQIHSFPDKGEHWRCPVLALEIIEGTLRMFNRWDTNQISSLVDGTCASAKNSIKSRKMFSDYVIEVDTEYKITILGKLALDDSGILEIRINDEVVGSYEGPNMFNDERGPYLKFGIYKPTWWKYRRTLSYQYTNFIFQGKKAWK
jgi:hypothetical protein